MGKITTVDGVRKLAKKVSNWGKWGPDDELGTVNYITPDTIVKAACLVKKGRVFQLGIELNRNGPQRHGHKGSTRFNPIHVMFRSGSDTVAGVPQALSYGATWGGADDMIALSTHGASHWDALCHVHGEGGKMWNGYEAELCSSWGAEKNGIEKYGNKLVGRGVLLDVARHKGTKILEPGYEISIEDLDACAEWEKVCVEPGDFLLVRTGKMEAYQERVEQGGEWGDYSGGDEAGLAIETAAWLHEKKVAGIVMDNWGCEVRPNATGASMYQPWHRVVLPYMGLLMGENLCFKALAEDCEGDKVYEFLFVAPPLLITGGAGTPINPYAIK
jgi:kynurenine formamidase